MLAAINVLIYVGVCYYFLTNRQVSLKSSGIQGNEKTKATKFCALIYLVYLAVGTDAGKKNKLCGKILDY